MDRPTFLRFACCASASPTVAITAAYIACPKPACPGSPNPKSSPSTKSPRLPAPPSRFTASGGSSSPAASRPCATASSISFPHCVAIDGIDDLSLTTNGQRLAELAVPLRHAGLDRVTISVDSLDPAKFRRITRTGDLATVLAGLDCAESVGLDPIKINCVTMRGINDDELPDFARLTLERESHRTIHRVYAPGRIRRSGPAAGCDNQNRGENALVPEAEARTMIENEFGPLLPVDRAYRSRRWPRHGLATCPQCPRTNRLHQRHVRPILLNLQSPSPHRRRLAAVVSLRWRRGQR